MGKRFPASPKNNKTIGSHGVLCVNPRALRGKIFSLPHRLIVNESWSFDG
jgi:hypothetical protein